MTSGAKFIPEIDLFACPFIHMCTLPKNEFCRINKCKICPEYTTIGKKTKSKTSFLSLI